MLSSGIENAKAKLTTAGLHFGWKGCTEEDVRAIEDRFHVRLPETYREFLHLMGRDTGGFLVGSSYRYPGVLMFRDSAEKLLRQRVPEFALSPTDFVFYHHQGYTYLWFDCNDADGNPPVVMYTEKEPVPRVLSECFSDWLNLMADDDIEANRRLNG